VELTYAGHQFLEHARTIISAVDVAIRAPHDARANVSGRIRVGVTYTVAGYFLPPHLARFNRTFPNVAVELWEAHRPDIEKALVRQELDLAVMLTSNLREVDEIASETLIRSRRRLWLPVDHPFLTVERVSLEDVAKEPHVMLTVDEAMQTALRYWERTPWRPRIYFKTSSVEAVRSMVAIGMGVTVLSDMVYRPWSLEGRRIETKVLADPIPSMDVGLAWSRTAHLGEAAQAFREHLSLSFSGLGQNVVQSFEPGMSSG
jgi:DNA-binding transcriptional LysR family regulator